MIKSSKKCEAGHCLNVRLLDDGDIEIWEYDLGFTGVRVRTSIANWEAFLEGAKAGEFDLDKLKADRDDVSVEEV